MHVILLALGLFMALAGLPLVGFGVATNAGALGNMLIVVGTIAVVGGLILVGLASAIGQLRRIAQALAPRPLPRALGPETAAAGPDPQAPSIASLPATKARFEPGRETSAPSPEPAVELPHAADRERPPPPEPQPPSAILKGADETPPRPPETQPMPAPVAEKNLDAVRPGGPAAEAPHDDAERVAAIEAEPVDKVEAAWAPPAADAARIFKSGVIDGMAYTLYTDGSIEAELAEGTVKFSSIDDLRAYLASRG